ncbi:MAG TPA: sigma-70 family RNA polymerase sigma factor [Gaiellaceae bacterium]
MTPLLAQRPRPDRSFERLYQRHVGDVYRYALAVMRNTADAEDVTQTTFLNAYRAYVEKGSRPEKPQNWLIAIAHNVCRQRFRQSARRPTEVTYEDDIADVVADDEAPSPEDIRRALGQLGFNQRAALVMRELEGRSYAEIAEILDLSTSAVETLIFRARRALREQLEGSLTCGEAEFAISRQLDGRLSREEKGQLRGHLRECQECARFARRQRAQKSAIKSLGLVPVPTSLGSLFGGGGGGAAAGLGGAAVSSGGAALGTGLAMKAAVAVTAGLVIGGAGYEGVGHAPWAGKHSPAVKQAPVRQNVVNPAAGAGPSRFGADARSPFPPGQAAKGQATRAQAKASGHATGKANGAGKPSRGNAGKSHKFVAPGRSGRPATHTGVAVGHSSSRTPATQTAHTRSTHATHAAKPKSHRNSSPPAKKTK